MGKGWGCTCTQYNIPVGARVSILETARNIIFYRQTIDDFFCSNFWPHYTIQLVLINFFGEVEEEGRIEQASYQKPLNGLEV